MLGNAFWGGPLLHLFRSRQRSRDEAPRTFKFPSAGTPDGCVWRITDTADDLGIVCSPFMITASRRGPSRTERTRVNAPALGLGGTLTARDNARKQQARDVLHFTRGGVVCCCKARRHHAPQHARAYINKGIGQGCGPAAARVLLSGAVRHIPCYPPTRTACTPSC